MQIHGLPETFWVVVSPSPVSGLGDICFQCDFEEFALQIRGGLDERRIVGIFAEEKPASELARSLLESQQNPHAAGSDTRTHKSPWLNWYGTQETTQGVFICDKATEAKMLIEPPKRWGRNWAWNISEDGTGIVLRRTS